MKMYTYTSNLPAQAQRAIDVHAELLIIVFLWFLYVSVEGSHITFGTALFRLRINAV